MITKTTHRILLPLAVFAASTFCVSITGCGKSRGTTKLTYSPPAAPLALSFTSDSQGNWTVAAGIATPLGTFSIEHQFARQPENTYIVFRDRKKGTDQVFALSTKTYVEIYTKGEHRLLIHREENKFIIDAETISGTITAKLHNLDSYVGRITWDSADYPDLVITYERLLVVDNTVLGKDATHVSLDSVKRIDLVGSMFQYALVVNWKDGIQNEPAWLAYPNDDAARVKFAMLQDTIKSVAPDVTFSTYHSYGRSFCEAVGAIVALAFILLLIAAQGAK
jgi:hypothetical protein